MFKLVKRIKLTRIRLLNHTDVVATVSNGTRSFTRMFLNE